jgi:hypothetical protein
LCPDYIGPTGEQLAGVSGDRTKVREVLKNRGKLTPEITSWVYWPGFTDKDNPLIAIIWERQEGVSGIGTRWSGHAVGLIDGSTRQIPPESWPAFLAEQERLRKEALASRSK